jgi:hypothetical protein
MPAGRLFEGHPAMERYAALKSPSPLWRYALRKDVPPVEDCIGPGEARRPWSSDVGASRAGSVFYIPCASEDLAGRTRQAHASAGEGAPPYAPLRRFWYFNCPRSAGPDLPRCGGKRPGSSLLRMRGAESPRRPEPGRASSGPSSPRSGPSSPRCGGPSPEWGPPSPVPGSRHRSRNDRHRARGVRDRGREGRHRSGEGCHQSQRGCDRGWRAVTWVREAATEVRKAAPRGRGCVGAQRAAPLRLARDYLRFGPVGGGVASCRALSAAV